VEKYGISAAKRVRCGPRPPRYWIVVGFFAGMVQ